MEVKLLRRHAVNRALYTCDRIEHGVGLLGDSGRCARPVDHCMDLGNGAPVWLRRNIEIDLDALHATPLHVGDPHTDSFQAKRRRQLLQPLSVQANVNQRPQEHVPGDTAGWIDDRDSHLSEARKGFRERPKIIPRILVWIERLRSVHPCQCKLTERYARQLRVSCTPLSTSHSPGSCSLRQPLSRVRIRSRYGLTPCLLRPRSTPDLF